MEDLERLHELEIYKKQKSKYAKHHGRQVMNGFYIVSILPMIILTYLQVIFNLAVSCLILWSIVQFIMVVLSDLEKHIDKKSYQLMGEMLRCSREYLKNDCQRVGLAPALETVCDEWKMCMDQDVGNVIKTKETAIILAQLLNNFFDNLTDRTIYCVAGILVGCIIFMNGILSWTKHAGRRTKSQ